MDWSKNRFDRLKVWKNQIFEKQSILLQKLLKAHCFIKNAWVWDEKFFKNTWIQPRSSKIKIFNQFVLKAQTLNTFCIKIKELLILDGHNKITHNIMYQVYQRVTCVVCATSKIMRYMWGDMWITINHKVYKIHHIEFKRDYHLKSYII